MDSGDAGAYLDQVVSRIMAVWRLPEKLDGRKVIVRMHLERSGRVSDVRVEKSSGDRAHFGLCLSLRKSLLAISTWFSIRPCPDSRVGKTMENSKTTPSSAR